MRTSSADIGAVGAAAAIPEDEEVAEGGAAKDVGTDGDVAATLPRIMCVI